ncbi:AAA family ATPase [Mycoplasma capricolum]|uniref:AAA family ATPase n=1 Tax=Mycoplasma capricolum TaxID=2095 RepID=UPI003DA47CD5
MLSVINSLIDYAKNEKNDFIKFVIFYYLENNCEINENQKKHLVESFITESYIDKIYDFNSPSLVSNKNNNTAPRLIIEKLTHISGCNAIIENKYIEFCGGINIIYGANGSGKSSYFRILKKTFSNPELEILPNIYLDKSKKQELNFSVDFIKNSEKQKYEYQKSKKILNSNLIFFDSEKQNQILQSIDKDKYAIYPNDFYLVKNLVVLLDDIVKDINKNIEVKRENNQKNISSIFKKDPSYLENLWAQISNIKKDSKNNFSNDVIKRYNLEKIGEILNIFEDQNQAKNIFDYDRYINSLNETIKHINNICIPWVEKFKEYSKLVEKYEDLIYKRNKLIESINFLNSIEGYKINDWVEFIQLGDKLSQKYPNYSDQCPYCQRKYDENSINLIDNYKKILNNAIQADISNTYKSIKGIINCADADKIKITDDLLKLKIDNQSVIDFINIVNQNILNISKNNEIFSRLDINFDRIDELKNNVLLFVSKNSQYDFSNYNLAKEEFELINEMFTNVNTLLEWEKNNKHLNKLREKISKTTSRSLSEFFKKLYSEYFSNEFVNNFNEYMKIFDKKNDFLKFKKTNVQKGEIQSGLLLETDHSNVKVVQIFSEGEMKSIILSLLFAEIKTWNNKNPLIFDDPVTSFDNLMIEEFCNIISKLNNQVIIFTHNMLLLDLMKPYLKNKENSIITVQGITNTKKGNIIKENNNNLDSHLEKVYNQLKKPESINIQECCFSLRLSIESIIDEIILNNQIPRKYTSKNIQPRINWNELVKIGLKKEDAEILKECYNRVSQGLHLSISSSIKPILYDDINEIYNDLTKFVESRRDKKYYD